MKNLFLAETQEQVADLIHKSSGLKGTWLALGPSAMWALEQQGISYRIPDDFFSVDDLEKICIESHDRVETLCNRLDTALFDDHPLIIKDGIRPYLFRIAQLIMLFDVLTSRIYQLRAILKAHLGMKVWIHNTNRSFPWGLYDIYFAKDEPLWGQLLKLIDCRDCQIEFLEMPDNSYTPIRPLLQRIRLGHWIKSIITKIRRFVFSKFQLMQLVHQFRAKGIKGILGSLFSKGQTALLVNNGLYDWAYTLALLETKGWNILRVDDQYFDSKTAKNEIDYSEQTVLDDLILKNQEIKRLFSFSDISLYPLLRERFIWILKTAPGLYERIAAKMSALTSKYDIKALLTTTDYTYISHAVAQMARSRGAPVIKWQHGFVIGRNGNIQQNEYNDLMTTDLMFTYGEEVSKVYRIYQNKFESQIVSIGSADFDKVRAEQSGKKQAGSAKTILYATASYYENRWYCGFSPPVSDCHLMNYQAAIMKSLSSIAGENELNVTVKLAMAEYHWPLWAKEYKESHRFEVISSSPIFVKLLLLNDIIILDSPTTTVLQAVATFKPLFILMSRIVYPAHAREMLQKRAICADTPEQLMESVKTYVETGIYDADMFNDEFLQAYGNHLNDGKSAERAVSELMKIVST